MRVCNWRTLFSAATTDLRNQVSDNTVVILILNCYFRVKGLLNLGGLCNYLNWFLFFF